MGTRNCAHRRRAGRDRRIHRRCDSQHRGSRDAARVHRGAVVRAAHESGWHQPLGKACIVFLCVLLLSVTWSEAPFFVALKAWFGWRHFLLLFIALAIFNTRFSKLAFAYHLRHHGDCGYRRLLSSSSISERRRATSDVAGGIILRNHVTQGLALTAGALLALVLLCARATRFMAAMGIGVSGFVDGGQRDVGCLRA